MGEEKTSLLKASFFLLLFCLCGFNCVLFFTAEQMDPGDEPLAFC